MTSGPALARVLAPIGVMLLALNAPAARAADAIVAPGRLSDTEFYRLVACAAPPGSDCTHELLRWQVERPIRVAVRRIDPAFLGRPRLRAEAAVTQALREVNAVDAPFRLARVGPRDRAEIGVYFLDLDGGGRIEGTGIDWVDGARIDKLATLIAVDPDQTRILGATIVVSKALETPAFEAALLKSMTRVMGLTTEVDGPAYESLSVLAHDSYTATHLGPQDRAALRRHYAAPAP